MSYITAVQRYDLGSSHSSIHRANRIHLKMVLEKRRNESVNATPLRSQGLGTLLQDQATIQPAVHYHGFGRYQQVGGRNWPTKFGFSGYEQCGYQQLGEEDWPAKLGFGEHEQRRYQADFYEWRRQCQPYGKGPLQGLCSRSSHEQQRGEWTQPANTSDTVYSTAPTGSELEKWYYTRQYAPLYFQPVSYQSFPGYGFPLAQSPLIRKWQSGNDSSSVPVTGAATFANVNANAPAPRQQPISKLVTATHMTGGFCVDNQSRSRPTKFDVFPSPCLPVPRDYAAPNFGSISSRDAAPEEQKSQQSPGVNTGQQPPHPTKRNVDALRLLSRLPAEPRLNLLERPEPSTAYMDQAHRVIRPVQPPRPLLVVLDLNGTLLHRKKRGSNAFVGRPKVYEFLQYLFNTSYVLIWSSAQPANVKEMCMRLLSKQQIQQLVGTWTRKDLRLPPHAYFQKVQVYKQLSWIWNDSDLQSVKPNPKKHWSQEDTVLIDDSLEKAASEPYNLIKIEEFTGRKDQMDLDVLGQVAKYMETLRSQADVSAYIREHPFEFKPDEDFDWAPIVNDMQ